MQRTNTSASNFHRRVGCPASARIERGLADIETEDSRRGTELHRLWANPRLTRDHLSDEDMGALVVVEKMAKEFDESIGNMEGVNPWWEHPFVLFGDTKHEMVNHPDRVTLLVPENLKETIYVGISDAKFGRLKVEPSESNWQLAVYAASYGVPGGFDAVFYLAIFQPWESHQVKPVTMTLDEVMALRQQIWDIMEATEAPDAPFNPTPANCRYCKGALHGVCPAYRETALAPVKDAALVEQAFKDPGAFLLSLEKDKRTQLLDALKMAEALGDVIRPAARAMLKQDKDAIPGYSVKPDTETRKITDILGAFDTLRTKMPDSEIIGKMSLSISAAEKLLKEWLPATDSAKEREQKMRDILKPYCDVTPRAGNLERE